MSSELAAYQAQFAALLCGDAPSSLNGFLAARTGSAGLAVYRNNSISALTGVMEKAYPAVARLVGGEFFRAAARAFIAQHPPRERSLVMYGGGFPDFLDGFDAVHELPYLACVARCDRAFRHALFAADRAVLTPEQLAQMSAEKLPAMRLAQHPSVSIVASRFPAFSIWRANHGAAPATRLTLNDRRECAAFWRSGDSVQRRTLLDGEAAFLRAVQAECALADVAEQAHAAQPDLDVMAAFAGMVRAGVFVKPMEEGTQRNVDAA